MNYNEIGNTGMRVSALSFGASSLGGVFHGVKETDAICAVHTAHRREEDILYHTFTFQIIQLR